MKGNKSPMTEARILDVSNDITEGIDNGQTIEELREVCRYWMNSAARIGALRGNQLAHVANCALQMMTEHKERRSCRAGTLGKEAGGKNFTDGPSASAATRKYADAWADCTLNAKARRRKAARGRG